MVNEASNDDDLPATYGYSASSNITFRGRGCELGMTKGEWRALSEEKKDAILSEIVWELVEVFVEDES